MALKDVLETDCSVSLISCVNFVDFQRTLSTLDFSKNFKMNRKVQSVAGSSTAAQIRELEEENVSKDARISMLEARPTSFQTAKSSSTLAGSSSTVTASSSLTFSPKSALASTPQPRIHERNSVAADPVAAPVKITFSKSSEVKVVFKL